ncbi:efflux RND transporter periplasmic adaptor subunit [Planctopirus hydrillae]|uniref:Uncharacterized protein n=1 Tax=Planctopirus hydrillae TaxID=1841610 RepID=A0A1C3E7F3_9PLAN|nr:efflux RND transporter periplasmic adaptor subunit [Planctopirus hydrillae]ODA29187.1 hypothetical protein A6X21_09645 [Planctopirus hydrillae]
MTVWSQQVPTESSSSPPVTSLEPEWRDFVLALQRSLRLPVLGAVIVHEGRRLLNVERVVLLWGAAGRLRVKAVSGSASFHAHSPGMVRLQTLVRRSIQNGQPFIYQAGITEPPSSLEDDLAGYIELSQTQYLAIIPLSTGLFKANDWETNSETSADEKRPPHHDLLGAIVMEQWSSPMPSEVLLLRGDDFLVLVATQLQQALRLSWIPFRETFARCGEFLGWLRGARLAMAAVVASIIVLAGLLLTFLPFPYRIDARGQILPSHRQQVFAPWDGQVEDLQAESGQLVSKGDVLLVLRNDELMAEWATVQSQWLEQQKQIVSLLAQAEYAEKEARSDEYLRLQGDLAVARRELAGLEKQREILSIRRDRLIVRAPITGRITTFQLTELLTGRPVRRGDALMEIADEQSPWQLELDIQEYRAGRLLTAYEKWGPRPVTYRVLTQPEATWSANLQQIGSRTELRPEQGQVIEAIAPIETNSHPALAIGADVRARIDCGPTVLGDAIFGDVLEFIQRWLWW